MLQTILGTGFRLKPLNQAAELERMRPPSPMNRDWYLLPLFLPGAVTEAGHFEVIAIHGMSYIFSTLFQSMRERKFTESSSLAEMIEVERGGLVVVIDSNESQPPLGYWKHICLFIKLLFVLVLEKEDIPGLSSKRTRSKKQSCFTVPLRALEEVMKL